ncbi:MAG: PAS domain S-box protein, partial [Syntrophales bacterium]|nr:PAS domain S-box protein [Syntrophales bacterium]
MVLAAGWVLTGCLEEIATQTVKHDVEDANLIISLNLTNELKRIESAALAVAGSPLILPVLQVNTPANMEKINNILDRYHKSLDAAACYLINRDGLTLASSNRNAKDSFVGQNYMFRSYFQQAVKGGVGRDFAVGTVTGRRGFFASAPVRNAAGQVIGVVVIKKELDDIETKLKRYIWFLVDKNGIIFLSSQPEARLKSLWPLSDEQKQKITLSKQYGPGPFEPVLQKQLKTGAEVPFRGQRYIASQVATPYEGISVVLLWPTGQISMYRSFGIILTLLAILLMLSFLTVIYIFTQSNFRMKSLLEETQAQAAALADSETQLRARTDELESQKEMLLDQRRELEEGRATLAQTEKRNRLILSSMSEGIVGLDMEGRVTFVNPAVSAILGYPEAELIGKSLHAQVHYAHPDGSGFPWSACALRLTSQDGKVRTVDDEVFWRKDGTAVPVEYSTTPVLKDGRVVAAVVSFHDITERKRAEGLKVEKEVAEEAAARAEKAQEELQAKVLEIERFSRLSLGREERVIELKRQVNA